MIKSIINKNLQYNILSLVSVFIGFLFIIYLGRKFGAGKQTDIYFLSIVIIAYLGYFIQSIWEAMSPYYVESKIKDKKLSDELYSILLNDLIVVSIIVISLYFLSTSIFSIVPHEQKKFLDIFIFYLLLQNLLLLNKGILNLEHFYASFYFGDIFVYTALFLTIFFIDDIKIIDIAYVTLFATFLTNIWQFYLIFKKIGINYSFKFYDNSLKELYQNSFKLKLGSLFYGAKDIIIASVFTSFGSGVYSLYSYANKFAGVILQVASAPIVNIFATKANYHVANKRYDLLKEDIKKVLLQITLLFISSALITYFLLPFMLNALFGDKFSSDDILTMQDIFLVMIIFCFMIILGEPFGKIISIKKEFLFILKLNFMYFLLIVLMFIILKFYDSGMYDYLYILLFVQLVAEIMIFIKYRSLIYEKI